MYKIRGTVKITIGVKKRDVSDVVSRGFLGKVVLQLSFEKRVALN